MLVVLKVNLHKYFHPRVMFQLTNLVEKYNHQYMDLKSWLSYMKDQVKHLTWVLTDQHIVVVVMLWVDLLGCHPSLRVMPVNLLVLVEKLLLRTLILDPRHIRLRNQLNLNSDKVLFWTILKELLIPNQEEVEDYNMREML